MSLTESLLQSRMNEVRGKSLCWPQSMQMLGQPDGMLRVSANHDAARWPQMLLSGTYDGAKRRPHRRNEIEYWLRHMQEKLLDSQNADGGFPDALLGERGYDGWVRGDKEPKGLSNTFAASFSWIAIGMIY